MKVFLVEYGVHDQDADVFASLWTTHQAAMDYAEQCAQEMFDDNLDYGEMGWTYDVQPDKVVIQDEDGSDIEWWRVTEQEVNS